jgi:hypothetical protein
MELVMEFTQTQNGIAPTNNDTEDFAIVKENLDLAWAKVQDALHQEAEGNDRWIEGTLEIIITLDDARKRFPYDQEFGAWLNEAGYGEDRLPRHHRQALLNMALHLEVTRAVLAQTERRSWRYIWELEIQPKLKEAQLPYVGQPGEGQCSEATQQDDDAEQPGEGGGTNNLAQQQPADPEKKPTRRQKRRNGTKKSKDEWGKDLNELKRDALLAANALIRIRQAISSSTPAKQAELLKKVTSGWLRQIEQGHEAGAWICDWANEGLDKEVDKDIQTNRVVLTPAPASQQIQPEA